MFCHIPNPRVIRRSGIGCCAQIYETNAIITAAYCTLMDNTSSFNKNTVVWKQTPTQDVIGFNLKGARRNFFSLAKQDYVLGCSDFDFFTFWGITTHPWHPKGPWICKLAKKNFQLNVWLAQIFGKNRKRRFFGMISKFNVRSPVWQIFTIFSACFIYGILNTYIEF